MDKYVVIIPTLKPNEKLIVLIQELKKSGFEKIVVWDDGSESGYDKIWNQAEQLGCVLGHHEKNIGKGGAIKSAIEYAHKIYGRESGYITVDGDGQHLPEDVRKVALRMDEQPQSLVLGIRNFHQRGIPVRSLFGNYVTSLVFRLNTSVSCPDTQTGLRGIPSSMREFALAVEGKRYEYEMNFLTEAVQKYELSMVPITTVYEENNQTSHFRPVRDSVLVYQRFVKFLTASLGGAIVDYLVFILLLAILACSESKEIWISTVFARIISGIVNYMLNRYWSFQSRQPMGKEIFRYGLLFITQMCVSAATVTGLSHFLSPIPAKIIVDTTLFFISYQIQKKWIFGVE